jgi:lipopolysaccharide export system permease protein
MSRTPEDLWSTNRAIKNIAEIKLGLDSITTIVNDLKFQNFQTAESIYPFFTKNRKLTPPEEIKRRKEQDDEIRKAKIRRESLMRDSLQKIENQKDSIKRQKSDSLNTNPLKSAVAANAAIPASDSLFQRKISRRSVIRDTVNSNPNLITTVDTTGIEEKKKIIRTSPLTAEEKHLIDSIIYDKGYITNAMSMALNNSRNLKNSFNVKMSQVDSHVREYRRYEIAWYQKYSQSIACFVMFLIGAPLGSIIKKGGLGLPVLISIIFFILFYMLTITGEKWAKEGLTDPLFGTVFSNLCLLPFGLFFLRQAKKDARLFEADFYSGVWKKVSSIFGKAEAKSP